MKKLTFNNNNQAEIVSIFSSLEPEAVQEVLWEQCKQAALAFGAALLEHDVEKLCGASFARKAEGLCWRGGSEESSIIVCNQKIPIRRPRVRNEQGEVSIPILKKLRSQDILDQKIHEKMLLGVSSRKYDKVIDAYSGSLGVSKSSASRAFVRASQKELDLINEGDLSKYSFVGIMIDGIHVGDRCVIAALGITSEMEKVPLGLKDGDTENAAVVKDLLSSIQERGFKLYCDHLLAVLDGGKALSKAVKAVWGEKVIVQRCWIHKFRNIKSYIPDRYHHTLLVKMRKLMGLKSYKDAQKEMTKLKTWLLAISYDAAMSLDEAGDHLLTLHKLGIDGELRKSLYSTNPIESLFSVVKEKIRRVKNWKSQKSAQALRWIASSILEHKKIKMRKLRGLNQKHSLISALNNSIDFVKEAA